MPYATSLFNCCTDCYDVVGFLETFPSVCLWGTFELIAETNSKASDAACALDFFSLTCFVGSLFITCNERDRRMKQMKETTTRCCLSAMCYPCSIAQLRRQQRFEGKPRFLITSFFMNCCCRRCLPNCLLGIPYQWSHLLAYDTISSLTKEDNLWRVRKVCWLLRKGKTTLENENSTKITKAFEIYQIHFLVCKFIPIATSDNLRSWVKEEVQIRKQMQRQYCFCFHCQEVCKEEENCDEEEEETNFDGGSIREEYLSPNPSLVAKRKRMDEMI